LYYPYTKIFLLATIEFFKEVTFGGLPTLNKFRLQPFRMYNEVYKLISNLKLPVSKSYLKIRLESHPDYPSILAIQDTLSELGIKSMAYESDKHNLKKKVGPFLLHFNKYDGEILFFADIESAESKVKDFDKYWSGVAMIVEGIILTKNKENDQEFKSENRNNIFAIAIVLCIIFLLFGSEVLKKSLPGILLLITNIAGLYLSWLIVQKELGFQNIISDKICSIAKQSRCEAVLFSKSAKLFSWLTWGDIGIVYFTTSLFYIVQIDEGATYFQFYYLLSLIGLMFPLYSLYYQGKIVKQWCMLCIGVLLILSLNALIGFIFLQKSIVSVNNFLYSFCLYAFITTTLFFFWQLLKFVIRKNDSSLSDRISFASLKRNPNIFNAILEKQELNNRNLPELNEPIFFGRVDAAVQITIACNPYCLPCAKAHEAVEKLYEKYPNDFSVAVRFTLNNNNDADKKVIAVKEILKASKDIGAYRAIKDWYSVINMEKFRELHCVNDIDVTSDIEKHILWSKNVDIKGTPTIFINGRQLPDIYSWKELVEILDFNVYS
jgi:thiol-disulfide isomerase/thioredoxin/uncharacterized membrane protein